MRCKSDSDALAVGKLPQDLPHCVANFAPSYCRTYSMINGVVYGDLGSMWKKILCGNERGVGFVFRV